MKEDVVRRAEAVLPPDAIFGSNTSTLPITSLAAAASRPANFVGIHFFSPVEKMMLVEIILGKKTGDAALARALDFVRAIRKTPIVVNDFARLLHLARRRHLHRRGPPHATRRRAGGDDRERRAHGRHAGRPAVAQRRDRARPVLQDHGRDAERSRRSGGARGRVADDRRDGQPARPPGQEERQGLLRLPDQSRRQEAALAGARRALSAGRRSRRHRHGGTEAALPGPPGAGDGALFRGRRPHRRPRSRSRLDPRLRLRALHRRHAVLHRLHGRGRIRRRSAIASPRSTANASSRTGCSAGWRRRATRFMENILRRP